MSDSQEQSLNEDVVFLPINESSPEFLHCEKERQAVERLLNSGPEAFYSSVGTERSGCFLSSEEVNQITSWAQDYRFNPLQVQSHGNGQGSCSEMEDFCSTYFPCCSDTPAPNLELGWPGRGPWVPKERVTVHTNPPAEGEPSIREIIRQHLQKAGQVIAIVTDRLTDGAIIGDLHNAAFRGVPVYIILNQRSIQENFTLNRLRHPNMQVRVLGGKSFCSRTGKMVVGEMKEKFLLVDLETVIHGSYSLTWTDAHLHRQLITVLSGAVVESFDREFRILFAASLPVPDTWRVEGSNVDARHQLKEHSDLLFKRHLHVETDITCPPSPPADSLLDWEAMGVVQRNCRSPDSRLDQHEEIMAMDVPLQRKMLFQRNTPIMGGFNNGNQSVDKKRVYENSSSVTNIVPDKSTTLRDFYHLHSSTEPSPTELTTSERIKRMEHIINKSIPRQLSIEKHAHLDDRTTTRLDDDKATEPTRHMIILSSSKSRERSKSQASLEDQGRINETNSKVENEPSSRRRERSKSQAILEDQGRINETNSKVENEPSSRKPIILRMPQSESFSTVNDIMRRLKPRQTTSELPNRGSKATVSEYSQSMTDLSIHDTDDDRGVPGPRLKASCFDPGYMTPALALMKKRNDELKPLVFGTPKSFLPRERPRSSTYAHWRRSWADTEGEQG